MHELFDDSCSHDNTIYIPYQKFPFSQFYGMDHFSFEEEQKIQE
jgi:hypothetical protein